jgi:uncharacterized spore protein YtfJ
MENGNFIEKLASQFGQTATVKNVYGEPVKTGEKTIIPVARIAYGLGGGYGQGNKNKRHLVYDDTLKRTEGPGAEGAGGGGGLYARPAGVYEVTSAGTRFIPANNAKKFLAGVMVGFLLRALFNSGSKRKNRLIKQ